MRIKYFLILFLVMAMISGCGEVEREIIVETDVSQPEHQKKLESTSITDREKKIIESGGYERKKFPAVRPLFTESTDWTIKFENNTYKISLTGGRGEIEIKPIKPDTDDPMKWIDEKMAELSSMGYYFAKKAYADNLAVAADNRDARMLMEEDFEKYFDPNVVTITGFFGNIDSIWQMNGYIKNEMDYNLVIQLTEGSTQIPWEE